MIHPTQPTLKDELLALENLRRSQQRTLDTSPAPPLQFDILDYAEAGLSIDAAMMALNEALPSGQLDRVVAAYNLLRRGTEDLGRWLRARGVGV